MGGVPLVFGGTDATSVFNEHSGGSFPTRWVTVHDTATSTVESDCNLAARAAGATPFKRPENVSFKPDGSFRTFYFTATGDTNNDAGSVPGLQQRVSFGAVFELSLDARQENGSIRAVVLGDATHNSFDNITFCDSNTILVGEDRGDGLHDQLNALDSIWAYPLSNFQAPLRVLAQGRDVSASGAGEEDNEPTGLYVSNGESGSGKMYGKPKNLSTDARGFFTHQHGDNTTYELIHQ